MGNRAHERTPPSETQQQQTTRPDTRVGCTDERPHGRLADWPPRRRSVIDVTTPRRRSVAVVVTRRCRHATRLWADTCSQSVDVR